MSAASASRPIKLVIAGRRFQLVVTGFRVADAFLDEGLAQVMGQYQKLVDEQN